MLINKASSDNSSKVCLKRFTGVNGQTYAIELWSVRALDAMRIQYNDSGTKVKLPRATREKVVVSRG